MKHYIEITLIENLDINLFSLWSKVFQQIHLGLVEMQDDQGLAPIGLSFPEYVAGGRSRLPASHDTCTSLCVEYSVIGSKLRLLAEDEATLARFNVDHWLSRLADYVHCTSIREIPAHKITGYAFFKRVRPDSSNERLARRRVKRKGVSFEQALAHYGGRAEEMTQLPFIQVQSQSSGQSYRLFIAKVAVSTAPSQAVFSTYGLSSQCAVPLF